MSRNYKFDNPAGVYFVSFAVVEWIDVFTSQPHYERVRQRGIYFGVMPNFRKDTAT